MSSHRHVGRSAPPGGMPAPHPFAHLHPDDGACLMEATSVLAGRSFTDSPAGTHPVLAALARAVNDAVGDDARRALWPLAGELADARPARRDFGPRLLVLALDAAMRAAPAARTLRLRRAGCARRAARLARARTTPDGRVRDAVWWHGPGRHHLEHALRCLSRSPDAEERLTSLLREAVRAAAAEADGRPGREVPQSPAAQGQTRQ